MINYVEMAGWRLQNPEHADSGALLIWNDAVLRAGKANSVTSA
ncbi:hypothetical protein [Enterobacter kobei]